MPRSFKSARVVSNVVDSIGFIAVETAIVMLLYLNPAYKKRRETAENEGHNLTRIDVEEAIFEGALLRLRSKIMTHLCRSHARGATP